MRYDAAFITAAPARLPLQHVLSYRRGHRSAVWPINRIIGPPSTNSFTILDNPAACAEPTYRGFRWKRRRYARSSWR